MKHQMRFIYLLIVTLIISNLIFGQQYSEEEELSSLPYEYKVEKTWRDDVNGDSYSMGFYNYKYSWQYHSGENSYTDFYHTVTFFHYSLNFIPNDAYNITAKIQAYRDSGTGNSKFRVASDNVSSNDEARFNAAINGSDLFTVDLSGGTWHNITSLLNSKVSQGYINFGVVPIGNFHSGHVTVLISVEWDAPSHITAKNNFSGGSIKVGVNSSPSTKSSPYNFTANVGATVNLRAVEQTKYGYYRLWNDTEAPSYKSKWEKRTGSVTIFKTNNISYSFPAATNDGGASYVANLRKRCNITFRNEHVGGVTGGTIKVNGANYNSPTSAFPVVEQNNIIGTANWHVINGIEYTFDYWSDGGGSAVSHTFNPSIHKDYKAYFVGRPLNSYGSYNRNLHFNTSDPVGTSIKVMWNQHPNSNVTKYKIYRKTKYGAETLISTVNRTSASSYTYTDGLYSITHNTSSNNLLKYDVRAYYSTEGTVSDIDWESVYGEIQFKRIEEELEDNTFSEDLEYAMSNYPNPFNPTTTIHYQLPEDANVSIKVFDILGKQVAELVNGEKGIGKHNVMFNSINLSAGLYFYIIDAKPTNLNGKGFSQTKKMLLVK